MQFPMTFDDFSLWFAITAIILWIALEIILVRYETHKHRIDRKKLRQVTLIVSILFIMSVAARVFIML